MQVKAVKTIAVTLTLDEDFNGSPAISLDNYSVVLRGPNEVTDLIEGLTLLRGHAWPKHDSQGSL